MINIDRNKVTVNQFDTCVIELSVCNYKLKSDDLIEYVFNGNKVIQKYDDLDLIIPTDKKGVFDYSVTILQSGAIRTEIIRNVCEVI